MESLQLQRPENCMETSLIHGIKYEVSSRKGLKKQKNIYFLSLSQEHRSQEILTSLHPYKKSSVIVMELASDLEEASEGEEGILRRVMKVVTTNCC